MASIHKKSDSWYIAYSDADGTRHFVNSGISHSPVGLDKADTKRKRKENHGTAMIRAIETEQIGQGSKRIRVVQKRCAALLLSARKTDAEQSGVRLKSYFDNWIAKKLPIVGESYGTTLTRCNSEFCTSLRDRSTAEICLVDEEDITDLVVCLEARKLGGVSINKRLYILDEMFGDAEKEGLVVVNPVTPDHYLEETPFARQAFSPAQTDLLLAATRLVDMQTVTLFGCYAGMRLNDGRSQTWDAIDFEKRIIVWVPYKTRRRRACQAKIMIVPIHPVLYAHLLRVRAMCGDSEHVTPSLAERPISNLSDEFVCLVRDAHINPLQITLPNGRKVCLLTHHSLRHEFRTELKRAGAPEKEATMLTGHSVRFTRWNGESISLVAQIYDHVDVEDLRKWIDRLPSLKVPGTNTSGDSGAPVPSNSTQ